MAKYMRSWEDALEESQCGRLPPLCNRETLVLVRALQQQYSWDGVFELLDNQEAAKESVCTPPLQEVKPEDTPKGDDPVVVDPKKDPVVCRIIPV